MADWRNRIVGSGEEPPDQLAANPLNWRIHPGEQQAALGASLGGVGWVQQVIVNRRTGYVLDGHARVALALRSDQASVPVLYVDLDEEEEQLVLATLDPIAGLAVTAADQYAHLVDGLVIRDAALAELVAGIQERALPAAGTAAVAPESFPDAGDPETAYCCPACGYEWSGKPR